VHILKEKTQTKKVVHHSDSTFFEFNLSLLLLVEYGLSTNLFTFYFDRNLFIFLNASCSIYSVALLPVNLIQKFNEKFGGINVTR